jgi:hypothetical protein
MATRYLVTSIREHWGDTQDSATGAELHIAALQELFPHYSYSVRPVTEDEVRQHTSPMAPTVHPVFAPIIDSMRGRP